MKGQEPIKLSSMGYELDLYAEMRRHNLLAPLLRSRTIAEAVEGIGLEEDELQGIHSAFREQNGLLEKEALEQFLRQRGWSEQDFHWQLELPHRIKKYCEEHFSHKAEAYFLSRKNTLDKVVYSLLRTKDPYLAQELYLRIDNNEANFGDLAAEYSEGSEKKSKGIIGPVPMTQAHPIVAELLRTTKTGVLHQPFRVEDWWLVLRLESYSPATLTEEMAQQMSRELFENWVNDEVERRMAGLLDERAGTTHR